ncbi:MAG TPA: FAD-linked oxidase C-terminal domain-containing protein [Thermoanaerobaculia bacterium]|nr:FAD-linked oxidase C-terminal domain-containing protein [Thermoanaerobaculia bacterium]
MSAKPTAEVDAQALAAELSRRVSGEVRFDAGSRALYATDASNYRQVPIGVVLPRSVEDVVETVATCRRYGAPFLSRGGGTSLAGQCTNVAVVTDFSKHMNRVLEIDSVGRTARVEPGTVLDDLRDQAERHGLTFGPDPASHNRCTLGGMIGNNSCGVHSVMAGKTVDNVLALDVLTYDGLRLTVGPTAEEELARIVQGGGRRGEIYARLKALRDRDADLIRQRFPQIPRRVSGYNLDQLLPENGFDVARALVGSEGTCVTVLSALLRLVPSPPVRTLLVLGYEDAYAAADHVLEVLAHDPIGLEGMDEVLVEAIRRRGLLPKSLDLLPPGRGWLLVEFGGATREESVGKARDLMSEIAEITKITGMGEGAPSMRLFDDPLQAKGIWKVRESGLGATARVGPVDSWEGWEDSAVAPEKLGTYLRALRRLYDKYGYRGAFYGHFGQGCVHTRIDFDLTSEPGIRIFRAFVEEAADLVVSLGGSLSGEHGDGQARAELLPRMFGPELVAAFREFKAIWDPEWKMNPGKVVLPYRLDENLRLGPDFHPPRLATRFQFPGDDQGSFARAALRCVGVGDCRKEHTGTMCPSYRVTRDEKDSTRGRARLLFEMLEGDPLRGGWRDPHVKDSLDLCLSCKGCKGECPVHVDMATYKAEFLSHYYEKRLRPRSAYAFGLVPWWVRLASSAPGLANFLTHAPGLSALAKAAAGMARQRQIPRFAPRTFKSSFAAREPRNAGRPRVILWPDTWSNHFHPEVAEAAVEVLEAAGWQVVVPAAALCCGRPLYDHGMLDLARRQLRQILAALAEEIAAGTSVVGLEPSCVSVFRDELCNLFPEDEAARRLAGQTFLLSELLVQKAGEWRPPTLRRKALVQGHCHHQALFRLDDEEEVLRRLGLDASILDSGCCGMAGAFGFEAGLRYDVSIAVGERGLLPAVRAAAAETLLIADGFSCREQIAQTTGRRALHLAQVLQMALRVQDVH